MGLGRSKEEEPPDDAAPPAPAETPPAAGITSDEEEAVQVRKAARARRVKGITGSPGVHSFHKQRGGDTPSRRQELARRVQEHHDAIFDTDATMFDASQRDVGVFEIIDGPYTPPMTLDEYEEELDGEEYKSSWDELFFDLALVAAFGMLANILRAGGHKSPHDHGEDEHHDDHEDHRRLSGGFELVPTSFHNAIILYCLETSAVIAVRRFTDGHRSQWRRNDLVGSVLLLARAVCVLGMAACAIDAEEGIWRFHAFAVVANGIGLISVLDSLWSRPKRWRTLKTEAINLTLNIVFSLIYACLFCPQIGDMMTRHTDHEDKVRNTAADIAFLVWGLYTPFMFCGSWMLPGAGIAIGEHEHHHDEEKGHDYYVNHDGIVPVNVEYVSERFGLLIIITCGESLFAGAAIVASSRSMLSLLMAGLCVYFALLVKLLYFELQGHVSEHAMDISQINGVLWTLAHLPVFVCSAGAGAVLHWAAIDPQENRWQIDERNLFLGFTCLLLFSLSLIMLLHGRLHNDRKHWWTKKYTRIFVRMALSIIMISGIQIKDHDNLWVLIYVCSFMTVDFIYEFVCKRAISSEHAREVKEHASPEISASKHHKHHNKHGHHASPAAAPPDPAPAPDDHKHEA